MNRLILILIAVFLITSCEKKRVFNPETTSSKRQVVFDEVGLLKKYEKHNLFNIINNIENELGAQLSIIILDTLNGESINQVALEKFAELNLGRETHDDGLLIVIAFKDHEVRIEVSDGLELIIKDDIAAKILREEIVPKFREDGYYEGIYLAITKIKELLQSNKSLIGKHYNNDSIK